MPEDYQDLVLATYRKKCEERKLHLNLLKPTVVKLKKECIKKYDASDEAKDVFSDFFDKDKMDDISLILSKADPGDFRPLLNHINGATKRTDEKNSELLAWLIDFQPRPSTTYYKSFDKDRLSDIEEVIDVSDDKIQTDTTEGNDALEQNQKEKESNRDIAQEKQNYSNEKVIKIIDESTDKDIEQLCDNDKKKEKGVEILDPVIEIGYESRFSYRYIILACILLLFIGSTSFVAWETSPASIRMPKADEGCMYWNEDHYEPVKCNTQMANATIIPLNLKKLQRQRKINLADTLTSYSLGKVWYKGFVKNHEFFTDSGAYPLDTQRVLKPLSNTILTKYTSNYRYWNARLAWFLCAAFFISLCGYAVSKLEKAVIAKDDSKRQDPEAVLTLAEEPIVEQTEGSLAM
ncbi:hypothetical protein ACEN2P_08260 [Pedobacter psychrotolerans]|uniref:hypothetical protein n=1 Tax=Pedobacter psychrotolerans TaxID=1843235 RepID=UPI003F95BC61